MYRTARLTIWGRRHLLNEATRIGVSQAARNMGVSRNTVYRWRRRSSELADRPCRPHRSPHRTSFEREAALLAARWEWRWGPDRLGPMVGIPRRTAYRILRRFRVHRLRELFPVERPVRGTFTASAPGEVLQIDIKTLGRLTGRARHSPIGEGRATVGRHRGVTGFEHVHVAVDAASRRTYLEVRAGLGAADCAAFVRNAVAAFDALGIRVRRSPTTASATSAPTPRPARRSECAGRGHVPITPGPMDGPNASSARCSGSVFMSSTSPAMRSAATRWTVGSLSTIAIVRTPHSRGSPPRAG